MVLPTSSDHDDIAQIRRVKYKLIIIWAWVYIVPTKLLIQDIYLWQRLGSFG